MALCQRYYEKSTTGTGSSDTTGAGRATLFYKVTKRAAPTVTAGPGSTITAGSSYTDGYYFYKTGSYAEMTAGATIDAEL